MKQVIQMNDIGYNWQKNLIMFLQEKINMQALTMFKFMQEIINGIDV